MTAPSDLREKLIASYGGLTPQMQRAARHILDHPGDVALKSLRRLARDAGVPPSTVSRLMVAIGAENWQVFRDHYQTRLLDGRGGYASRARATQHIEPDQDRDRDLFARISAAEAENIAGVFAPDMLVRLQEACGHIERARRIFVVGRGAAYAAAFQFSYAYQLMRDTVVLLDGRSGSFGDQLRTIGRSDVLIAIGASPYIRDTVRAVEFARSQHCPVIAVTDSDVSPLAVDAVLKLVVSDQSPSFFQSFTAAVAILQALVALLVARGGQKALQRIAVAEEQLAAFDTYYDNAPLSRNFRP